MKKTILLTLFITVFSCGKTDNPLLGLWKVNSKFYKATCQILEENNEVKGLVLYYNDDTTVYSYKDGQDKNYFFNNIKKHDNVYIDAVSGATKTEKSNDLVTLNLISKDTLEVKTYLMKKPIKEIWIKQ